MTVGQGVYELSQNLKSPCFIYGKEDFIQRKIERDSTPSIFIVEAAYLEHAQMSVQELKGFFPSGKVVVLGSDTFYHISRGSRQFQGLEDCDLFLDLMEGCAAEYSKYCKTDIWDWTINKRLNNYLGKFAEENKTTPIFDFISVLGPHTVYQGYRRHLINSIKEAGYSFTRGDSEGYQDKDMDKLYRSYLRSKYTLGTSSHHNTMRSAKGFRDAVGISLGRLLLVDDFPDSVRQYRGCGLFYKYDDLDTLFELVESHPYSSPAYLSQLKLQQDWLANNLIEQQLERLFTKYGII